MFVIKLAEITKFDGSSTVNYSVKPWDHFGKKLSYLLTVKIQVSFNLVKTILRIYSRL